MRDGYHAFSLGIMIVELTLNKRLVLFNVLRNENSNKDAELARRYTKKLARHLQVDLDIDAIVQTVIPSSDLVLRLEDWQQQTHYDILATHPQWTADCCDFGFEFASYYEIRGGFPLSNTATKDMVDLLEQKVQERARKVGLDKSLIDELIEGAKDSLVSNEDFLKIASKVFKQIIDFLDQDDKVAQYNIGNISNSIVSGLVQGVNNKVAPGQNTIGETEIAQVSKDPPDRVMSGQDFPDNQKEDQIKIVNPIGEGAVQEAPRSTNSSQTELSPSLSVSEPEQLSTKNNAKEDSKAISNTPFVKSPAQDDEVFKHQHHEEAIAIPEQTDLKSPTKRNVSKKSLSKDNSKQNISHLQQISANSTYDLLLSYKAMLEQIQEQLKPSANLHNISRVELDMFQIDLSKVIEEMDNLKNTVDLYRRHSLDAIQTNIAEAINELSVAMKLLRMLERGDTDMKDIADTWRSFFGCLIKCEKYLSEALDEMSIKIY